MNGFSLLSSDPSAISAFGSPPISPFRFQPATRAADKHSMSAITSQAIASTKLDQALSVAVARKALDAQQQEGQAAIALIQAAAQTQAAASPEGVGQQVDVRG